MPKELKPCGVEIEHLAISLWIKKSTSLEFISTDRITKRETCLKIPDNLPLSYFRNDVKDNFPSSDFQITKLTYDYVKDNLCSPIDSGKEISIKSWKQNFIIAKIMHRANSSQRYGFFYTTD